MTRKKIDRLGTVDVFDTLADLNTPSGSRLSFNERFAFVCQVGGGIWGLGVFEYGGSLLSDHDDAFLEGMNNDEHTRFF